MSSARSATSTAEARASSQAPPGILTTYQLEGRTEFTNKELRVEAALQLRGYRDNLEARIILLRRRLEQRAAPLRIVKSGRGRFRLVLSAPFELACN